MNGQELIERFAAKSGVDRERADRFYKEFFQVLIEGLEKEGYVRVKGLGSFKLLVVERRESININTGERFEIQGHNRITFTPEPGLKELVNKPFAHLETVVLEAGSPLESAVNEDKTEATETESVTETVAVKPVETEETKEEVIAGAVTETVVEPVTEPLTEPVNEPLTEPVGETVVEPATEPIGETMVAPAAEPVNEPVAMPIVTPPPAPIVKKEMKDESPRWIKVTKWIMLVVFILCVIALLMLYIPGLRKLVFEKRIKEATEMQIEAAVAAKPSTAKLSDAKVVTTTPATESVAIASTPAQTSVESAGTTVQRAAITAIAPDSVSYDIVGTQAEYTIGEGETLARVALHFYGTKALWPYIVKYNQAIIPNPDRVTSGLRVRIPRLEKRGE
ncbi:MAG: HU family DNA-binding protein [Prevotellaceae bacterium]|nr:HU family DNA-binding protein [Prevotellaceae bacterium]